MSFWSVARINEDKQFELDKRVILGIAESFFDAHKDIKRGFHTHYWFKGGTGSTKSSFIYIEIVLEIMKK